MAKRRFQFRVKQATTRPLRMRPARRYLSGKMRPRTYRRPTR